MKWIVNFSGGLCSLFASLREIERHGRANVINLFADTLYENQDLHDFLRRSEDVTGVPVTRISYGLNPWQLFRKEGMIGNNGSPICSIRLKREPLNAWMESRYNLADDQSAFSFLPNATVTLGFDWTELHRVTDFQVEHPTWRLSAPMTEAPYWDKCRMIGEAEKLGFVTPEAYVLGFPHNNCGMVCVRAGISHFVHLHKVKPKRYLEAERDELETIKYLTDKGCSSAHFTILRDRRGGTSKPLSLRDLRLRIESGEQFPRDEWGGCGCGGEKIIVDERPTV